MLAKPRPRITWFNLPIKIHFSGIRSVTRKSCIASIFYIKLFLLVWLIFFSSVKNQQLSIWSKKKFTANMQVRNSFQWFRLGTTSAISEYNELSRRRIHHWIIVRYENVIQILWKNWTRNVERVIFSWFHFYFDVLFHGKNFN